MSETLAFAPYQIICEGAADEVFIRRLLLARWGVSDIQVRCAKTKNADGCAGTSGLTDTLLALDAIRTTMPGKVRGILILFDSDDDPNATFKSVIESIKRTKLKYPQPSALLEIKPGDPVMAVATLPWIDKMGHLRRISVRIPSGVALRSTRSYSGILQCYVT